MQYVMQAEQNLFTSQMCSTQAKHKRHGHVKHTLCRVESMFSAYQQLQSEHTKLQKLANAENNVDRVHYVEVNQTFCVLHALISVTNDVLFKIKT